MCICPHSLVEGWWLGGLFAILVAGMMGHHRSTISLLLGKSGVTLTDLSPTGQVRVAGEIWQAVSIEAPVEAGRAVVVVGGKGLTLEVAALPPGLKD